MTDKEVERVAELLAKIGGSWSPERAVLERKMVTSRHRDVARLILAEVRRAKAGQETASPAADSSSESESPESDGKDFLSVGATVEYCPPGDKRTLVCRIEKLDGDRAYITPVPRDIGWVSTHTFLSLKSKGT